jgi:DNA-binding NarL/FixJ family response regulator
MKASTRPEVVFFLGIEDMSRLTMRQWEILGLLSLGRSQKEIPFDLRISESTLRNHLDAIRKAFDCHSTNAAVSVARRNGYLVDKSG